jgi:hypothetical protein
LGVLGRPVERGEGGRLVPRRSAVAARQSAAVSVPALPSIPRRHTYKGNSMAAVAGAPRTAC